jgi:hypothetical protein
LLAGLIPLECGGLTPLWYFLSAAHMVTQKKKEKKEKKENGVEPPHSKVLPTCSSY